MHPWCASYCKLSQLVAQADPLGYLKPISGYIHDWMHTMASQGVMQRSIWLLLSQLDMWDQLEPFLQLWTLPKAMAKAGNLHDLFQTKKIKFYKENSKFKCTASEAIGLSTLLAYLVNTICVPAAAHLDQCNSFLAMVQVLEMLQATQLGQVQPPRLQQAIEEALGSFKNCNGEAMMLRKHHWMLHLATHLQVWGFLPNCFRLERKHKTIMKFGNQTKKLTGFSLSLLEECLAHDLYNLQHSDHLEAGVQLLNKHAPNSKFHAFFVKQFSIRQFQRTRFGLQLQPSCTMVLPSTTKILFLSAAPMPINGKLPEWNTTLKSKGLCTPL